MAQAEIPADALKESMKAALVETLSEQRELIQELFTEVLEDFALVEAIEEGRRTESVSREQVFDLLEGES